MAATVTFDGTRVNSSDSNTDWGNWGSGGGAPASEAQLAYQGSGAVNTQVKTTALDGIDYDPGSGALDMESAAFPLWFAKVIVSDSFDLDTSYGVKLALGSAQAANQEYNVAGSGANRSVFDVYPAQGGYLIVAINPNVAGWIEADNSATLTAVDWFGAQCSMVVGGAKSENLALDAIDVGRGLFIVGTSSSADDLLAFDQDISGNRYGVVVGIAGQIVTKGLITWGRDSGGTAQVTGTDIGVITFPDGYHAAGDFGMLVDLDTASTDIDFNGLYISGGDIATEDTRADFVFSGTTGVASIGGTIKNFRNITLTSVTPIANADIECQTLVQASADIEDSIIRTRSLTSIATLQDPTFGSTTDLHDVEFVQAGAGHALEIDTAASYTLNNIVFTGYGADTTDDAAIDITETTGTVTLNIIGGSTPTFKTAGATVVIVANPVTLSFHVIDITGLTDIENARVFVNAGATGPLPYQDSVDISRSDATTAVVVHTAHGLANGQKVQIIGADQPEYNGVQTIANQTTNDYEYTVSGTPTTPATGTITSTATIIEGLTDSAGVIFDTRTYAADQDFEGRVRKSTGSPYYKNSPQTGTIDKDIGQSITVGMISDE